MRYAFLLLLAGCPLPEDYEGGAKDSGTVVADSGTRGTVPTEGDVDTDTDADTTEPSCDTGIAVPYWEGRFETDGVDVIGARLGLGYFGLAEGDWACTLEGDLTVEAPAPSPCPGCAWAWDMSAVTDSVATGPYCGDGAFGSDGELDGTLDYEWGFASRYAYDYRGSILWLEDALLVSLPGYGWYAFAFNLPSYGLYQTEVDGSGVSFTHAIGSYAYYYYDLPCD